MIYGSNFNKPGPKHAGRHLSGPQVSGHINDGAACMVSTPVMINDDRHRRPYETHMYNYNPIYQREGVSAPFINYICDPSKTETLLFEETCNSWTTTIALEGTFLVL